jgi:APA family basic amino acid/polyamine antiporter
MATVDRKVGLLTATSLVVANMIGAGIFTTSGIMAGMLPGVHWIFLCWIAGGTIALAGALCYAELATRMPEEGGEYAYLRKLYHPVLGFLTGWISFVVGFTVAIAASAMAFAEYVLPEAAESSSLQHKTVALILIAGFTVAHYLGISVGSRLQNVLTGTKVVIILGLAGAGLVLGGDGSSLSPVPEVAPTGSFALGAAMMLVMFSYSGWNASAYIAEEVAHPGRNLPRSLVAGTCMVIGLYLLMNLFIFHALPYGVAAGSIAVVRTASVAVFGEWMGTALGYLVAVALLSSLSAFIMLGPRVYFAMARDGLFFRFASAVHPRFQVPGRSILVQGAIAMIMVLVGSFEQLLIYLGFSLSVFPFLTVAGIFIARKRMIGESTAVRVPGYPYVPLFFLTCTFVLMVLAYWSRPLESTAAVLTVLLGIPAYLLWIRLRAPLPSK